MVSSDISRDIMSSLTFTQNKYARPSITSFQAGFSPLRLSLLKTHQEWPLFCSRYLFWFLHKFLGSSSCHMSIIVRLEQTISMTSDQPSGLSSSHQPQLDMEISIHIPLEDSSHASLLLSGVHLSFLFWFLLFPKFLLLKIENQKLLLTSRSLEPLLQPLGRPSDSTCTRRSFTFTRWKLILTLIKVPQLMFKC